MFAMLLALAGPGRAEAADLHLALKSPDGVDEASDWAATETFRKKYGPVQVGKSSAVYSVTIPAAVYDPLEDAYRMEVSVCVEWSRKGANDQFCQKDDALAPAEAHGPRHLDYAVKGKDKFRWAIEIWFTGEPPVPAGLPAPEPEPEPDELQ